MQEERKEVQQAEEVSQREEEVSQQEKQTEKKGKAKWWVLWVRGGKEDVIKKELEKLMKSDPRIEEVFIPEEEVKKKVAGKEVKVKKNITSGYIYVKMKLEEDLWKKIREIPNIGAILGDIGRPMPVSETTIQNLKRSIESGRIHMLSKIYVGDRVRIKIGSYKGFEGVVESISKDGKARVLCSILGHRTPVEVSVEELEKIEK